MRKTCPRCTRIINMNQSLCGPCLDKDNQRRNDKSRQHGTNLSSWRRFRSTLIYQRGQRCQDCGAQGGQLSLHYKPGGIHTRNPDDYLVLCLSCHGTRDAPRSTLNG